MFTYAIRLGVVLDNVASALDQRKVESKQVEIPTQEQFEKLIKTMRKADPRGEPGCNLVELLAYSGMRLNEGVNLLWGMLILIEQLMLLGLLRPCQVALAP